MEKNIDTILHFEKNYNKYKKIILKIVYSYVGNYYDSQDIMQEVFYKYLYKAPQFKDEEHEKRWLIRVAINLSKDYCKSFWKRKRDELPEDMQESKSINEENVIEQIKALDSKYKNVILLFYVWGYNLKETAAILKISEAAVKMRLARARQALKLEMEN